MIREDPERRGLLYAGTEQGVFVSFDDGARWQSLQLNLPRIPVTDLRVHHGDLVVSTQGRSLWILDDLSPLRRLADGTPPGAAGLFPPRDAFRAAMAFKKTQTGLAENPPYGATLFYWLGDSRPLPAEVTLRITGPDGRIVQTFSSERDALPNPPEVFAMTAQPTGDKRLTKKAGLNRFVWDLRCPVVDVVPDAILWGFSGGPAAVPGTYRATLTAGDVTASQDFRVLPDPRLTLTPKDYEEQFRLMQAMRRSLDRGYDGVRAARSIRDQVRELLARLRESGRDVRSLEGPGAALTARLAEIEDALMQRRNQADQDVENFPTKLDNQLAYVYGLVGETDARPTDGQIERARDLETEIDAVLKGLDAALGEDLPVFNAAAAAAGAAAVMPPRAPER